MRYYLHVLTVLLLTAETSASAAEFTQRTANNGMLVLEDVPRIPAEIRNSLNRYQAVRSARFRAWSKDGQHLYVTTRFGDVDQIHRVDRPGGARRQLTYFREPVGEVARRPEHAALTFTRDTGGSEFAQIFLFDPVRGTATQLSDGASRNGAPV